MLNAGPEIIRSRFDLLWLVVVRSCPAMADSSTGAIQNGVFYHAILNKIRMTYDIGYIHF